MIQYHNCYVNVDQSDMDSIQVAITENSISGKGPFVEKFEESLRNYFQSDYAICCSSGTAGIHMILFLENIKPGDEVMLPPTAPIMCALPILAVGAKPIFVDTESDSFNISIQDLEKKRTGKTKLLINVPMWGYSNNIDEVAAYCKKANIKVLEDNSHCHGTTLGDRQLGTFGDYAVFSTHERKLITTGEGGFILVKDQHDYEKLLEIRSFGEMSESGKDGTINKGAYGYYFGLNFKLSSLNASLGVTQLKKLEDKIAKRRTNAEKLAMEISQCNKNIRELKTKTNTRSNYYSIVFVTLPDIKNKIEKILLENKILSDPLRYKYCPLYELPIFKEYSTSCPNAENLIKSVFTLPVHEGLSLTDLNLIAKVIKDIDYD